jgi:hypothetical protein
MSERDDRYARNDLPKTTAEFRARPDPSASTAKFKAFAAGQEAKAERSRSDAEGWPEQPWAGEVSARRSGRSTAFLIGVVVLVALIFTIIVLAG